MHKAGKDLRLNNAGLLIYQAASLGDLERLEFVFNSIPENEVKKSINYRDSHGMTPLLVAAKKGSLECVKLLLYHGADINCSVRVKLIMVKAWHVAKKAGHLHLEQYLRKCHHDFERMDVTRARLELTVVKIAADSNCTVADRERFDVNLQKLIMSCGYSLRGGSAAEETDSAAYPAFHQPLIIRAARADNIPIVIKLIKKFKVDVMTHDLDTAETLLHIACQKKSKLRYYLVRHHPSLLRKRDINGSLPLHMACKENDTEFVSWLFQNILSIADRQGDMLSADNGIRRARSQSDVLSTTFTIPSNRSLQSCFPLTPTDLTSLSPQHKATAFHAFRGSDSVDYEESSESTLESDRLSPLTMNAKEQGLLMSYDSSRSYTVSVGGSSRSGSSERSFRRQGGLLNSVSSEEESGEAVDGGGFGKSSRSTSTASKHSNSGEGVKENGVGSQHSANCHGVDMIDGQSSSAHKTQSHKPIIVIDEEEEEEVKEVVNADPDTTPHNLTISDIVDIKPFTINVEGDSIFHILARNGFSKCLDVTVAVANFLKHRVDLSILAYRGSSTRLPIECAIYNKNYECVRMLIQLALVVGLMPSLLQDPDILKVAVLASDIKLVRILIESGFHKGLNQAISMALISEFQDILRVLLYWQTQVVNSTEFSRVKMERGRRVRGLDHGVIKWGEIQLVNIHQQWLKDSCSAVTSVARLLSSVNIYSDITEHDFEYFRKLGNDCLQYFDNLSITWPAHLQVPLAPITEINLSENQLTAVPDELFQMASLRVLRLSHNKLRQLPTSDKVTEDIYISNLTNLELDWNDLTELPEDMFRGLAHSLKDLSVQNNKLKILPPGMWVMPHLKRIKLAHNELESLHSLSIPSYFSDMDLSKTISSSFTVNSDGELECTSDNRDTTTLRRCGTYLKRLAMFYHTVCTTQCPKTFCSTSNIYQEVINVHLSRYLNFNHSESEPESIPESAQILSLFEDDDDDSTTRFCMDIELLDLSHNQFKELPWDLACISPNLKKLNMSGNQIQQVDIIHSMPKNITSLVLMCNSISALNKERSQNLPCGTPLKLLCMLDTSDGYCEHCNHPTLNKLSNLVLDHNKLSYFPIVDTPRVEHSTLQNDGFEVVYCDPYYSELSVLSLAHNDFTTVPKFLHRLMHLSSLTLSHNRITELPLEMGLINSSNLLLLKLEGMFLRNVPETLLSHTPRKLLNYLKALKQKSRPYRRMKLMVVGAANMGKTSLLLNLVKRGRIKRFTEVEMGVNDRPLSTVGVELGDWEYSHGGKPKVTFMTWDFGGQEEYYATHQCFLTRRSLYLLLWSVTDGEEGLKTLKPWLENIESCAPKSPVIVIGTHVDQIPSAKRAETLATLQHSFRKMYVNASQRKFTYPSIHSNMQFMNVNAARDVDKLRDYIYEFAIQYKVRGPSGGVSDCKPLLDEPVPESYIVLQDLVRETAEACVSAKKKPILTKKQFLQIINDSGKIKEADIDQATSFLHDSGILLHYEDSTLLNDLYFINPQWLCSMLARLITIKEANPFQKQGFMLMEDVKKIYSDCFREIVSVMQKFEVVFLLDERRLLIPSLLPQEEDNSCLVFSSSLSETLTDDTVAEQLRHEPHAPMHETPHTILTRYYLLPFIPNGFFSRLTARLMSTDIIDHLQHSLLSNAHVSSYLINTTHWKCWRTGILITWNHMEIFRIAPLADNLAGMKTVEVVTKKDMCVSTDVTGGLEIKVATLPEEFIQKCSTLDSQLKFSVSSMDSERRSEYSRGKCLATWLLHQATTAIDNVFEDWYESFARKKGFDPHQENVRIANPCNHCMERVTRELSSHGAARSSRLDEEREEKEEGGRDSESKCYVFTSLYTAQVAANHGESLTCPSHGTLMMSDVAPDLVFCDFLPGTVFADPSSVVVRQQLGDGGFGTVYRATLHARGNVETVAAKCFTPDMSSLEQDPDIIVQLKAWDVYQKASQEGRVMHQLAHPNILGLVGIALHPLSLLVELAPAGDLKHSVEKFKRDKVRLSRRTLQATLTQVAEALNYLHSKQFIYRDLKPENVLVWKFPRPETQGLPGTFVWVKVADYGISKQITPQGIRGMEGTRPYLPPEVILHGGREAYSNKLDVYAFGMFIYYLVSFRTPFDSGRPLTALLEERKRPELLARHRPHSLLLYELMCWCWSDMPAHRPNFNTVLEILRSDIFIHLLASFPVFKQDEEVTTSCIRLMRTRRSSGSVSMSHSTMVDQSVASQGIMGLVYGRGGAGHMGGGGGDYATQVWYGTLMGKFGYVQFQNQGVHLEQFELPEQRQKYISAVRNISSMIWVATVGCGLLVYEPNSNSIIARWGTEERYKVYTIMEVPGKTPKVLVFTHRGVYVFESDVYSSSSESLIPIFEYPKAVDELNVGVVIPPSGKLASSEVWASSLTGQSLHILNTSDFSTQERVPFRPGEKKGTIRHMIALEVSARPVLAVANKHLIHFFDVEERSHLSEHFDCQEICSRIPGFTRNAILILCKTIENWAKHGQPMQDTAIRAGALAAKDHFLYAAVKGVILCLNCESMEVVRIFDAYHKTVRSLLMINYTTTQAKPFDRLLSRVGGSAQSSSSSVSSLASIGKQSSDDSMRSHGFGTIQSRTLHTNDSYCSDEGSTNTVLISFGVGYKGVVKDCHEHPESFLRPSEGHRTPQQPAVMNRDLDCLLLWSTEVCKPNRSDDNVSGDAELLEEGSALPDDVVSSY